ncbi:MAG: hypothetical protein IK014_06020 [Lachnospiraceae bacterium]|nr:hypothetical protein [Lachnospiraceae bacterium]
MIGKKSIIALILLIAVLVCGCSSAPEYNITDDESDAIAQYCAYLLLKYDKNKTAERKLLDKKELEDIYNAGKEENVTEAVTPTPPITDPGTPTPTPTEAPEVTDTPTPTPEITEEPKNLVSGLTELYGKTDFTVEYGYYKLSEKYVENEYSVITPKQDGEKVLALYFLIKNISASKSKFVSKDSNVNYYLYCDNGDILGPQICALPNDIQFLNDDINAGGSYDAVLLFFVNDSEKTYKLKAKDDKTGYEYEIKIN